nr:hypothetical protein [uncultured Schaedlerella sp.]
MERNKTMVISVPVRRENEQEKLVKKKVINVEITGYKKCMKKIKNIKRELQELRDLMEEVTELKKKL